MAAFFLLLAAALTMQVLVGCENAVSNNHSDLSNKCQGKCMRRGNGGSYKRHLSFMPISSDVTLTFWRKTGLSTKRLDKYTVRLGETMDVRSDSIQRGQQEIPMNEQWSEFEVSGPIMYCDQQENIHPKCLSFATATTTTTTTTTTTITTTTETTAASISTTTATDLHNESSHGLEIFLLILSAASVLLRLLLVAKGGLAYCRTLAGLDRNIAAAKAGTSDTSQCQLYALRRALVLDFGLRLCLCMLLPCACVCAYGLFLILNQYSHNLSVPFYILGAACLLLHGFYCTRKVNSIITTVIMAQQRPHSTSCRRRHTSRGEDSSVSGSSERVQRRCPSQIIMFMLKVCLMLLLVCLCLLSYSIYFVVKVGIERSKPVEPGE